jgi:hypothetical protein
MHRKPMLDNRRSRTVDADYRATTSSVRRSPPRNNEGHHELSSFYPCRRHRSRLDLGRRIGPLMGSCRAELVGSDTATALGISVMAHTPVLQLCRVLVANGHDPTTSLEAYREATLCLIIRSIGEGAELEPNARGTGFRRRRAEDAGPAMRQTDRALVEDRPIVEGVLDGERPPDSEAAR